jgi:dTDP-4-amino-4,6-dideoxygalactose transaminase
VHYIPIHTQSFYRGLGFNWGDFPNAERYYTEAVTLPIFPRLTPIEVKKIVRELVKLVNRLPDGK